MSVWCALSPVRFIVCDNLFIGVFGALALCLAVLIVKVLVLADYIRAPNDQECVFIECVCVCVWVCAGLIRDKRRKKIRIPSQISVTVGERTPETHTYKIVLLLPLLLPLQSIQTDTHTPEESSRSANAKVNMHLYNQKHENYFLLLWVLFCFIFSIIRSYFVARYSCSEICNGLDP